MHIKACGEQAVLVEMSSLNEVLALHRTVTSWQLEGIVDLVPAATTLLIMIDTAQLTPKDVASRLATYDPNDAQSAERTSPHTVIVPVRYDGPDLAPLSEKLGWSPEELVKRHTHTQWTAAFGGFAPGFMYLVPADPFPSVPRLDSPRPAIPAGSVGLAGEFSGIYPQNSPGGWQLIGSTKEVLWDPTNDERPALIMPGDIVRFVEEN